VSECKSVRDLNGLTVEWCAGLCEVENDTAGETIEQHCGASLLDGQVNAAGVGIVHTQECHEEA
jgi:hypothetical protein